MSLLNYLMSCGSNVIRAIDFDESMISGDEL